MNNQRLLVIGGITLIVILAISIFFKNDRRSYNWLEHYRANSKDPYGLYIIKNMLGKYPQADATQNNSTSQEELVIDLDRKLTQLNEIEPSDSVHNFVFIGPAMIMDSTNEKALLDFVAAGNQAFISSKTIPNSLMDSLLVETCSDYTWTDYIFRKDSTVSINFLHENLADSLGFDFHYLFSHAPKDYKWNYLDPDYFCEEPYSLVELGAINENDIMFARKSYGAGNFYLHSIPMTLTNIQLMDTLGLYYAGNVFSHLGNGKIFCDEVHKTTEGVGRRNNNQSFSAVIDEGPLSYILGNRSLRAAWYMFIAIGIFYLIFRTRRRQRIIPVLPPNKNASLDFISTIGSLYYLQKDHQQLGEQQKNLFLNFVRDRYDVNSLKLDETFVNRLHGKSNVPKSEIQNIVNKISTINSTTFREENQLAAFYRMLSKFYKQCK